MSNLFDVVIPIGPNDVGIVPRQVEHTKKKCSWI